MAIIKCKMCGGDIQLAEDKTFGTCEYCGSTMTLPKVSDDQRAAAFNRGNHFRRMGEFDKALGVYERIVAEDDTDAEAHWCCALSRFGIEYVEDPATYEWLPTCHRASFDSFLEDVDYLAALEHSDGITRRQYQKDAAKIAEVQRGILATSQNTEPYDVFISYKELDENGERTRDSILAQEIYYRLTEKGWRVFFSRITLEDVPGTQYEPYIFAALNSAKVMIVVGTSAENLSAVWVKNEWSRFLSMMRKDRSKLLIPCYRDMDPYDLPEQLSVLMSYDMGKIGFIQDLIRGVDKVLSTEKKPEPVKETVVVQQGGGPNVTALLKRGQQALEDGEWDKAKDFFDQVLSMDAENAEAFFGLFLADAKCADADTYIRRAVEQKGCTETLNISPSSDRIEAAIKAYTVPGYLPDDEIQKLFTFDLSYPSVASSQASIAQQEKAKIESNRNLNRAFRFASGEKSSSVSSFKARFFTGLERNVVEAQAQTEAARKAKEDAYTAFLAKAETKAIELRQAAEEKREADYQAACEAQQNGNTIGDFITAIGLYDRLHAYKDSADRIRECRERIDDLTELARKEKLYKTCQRIFTGSVSNELKNWRAAREGFESLGDYKDSRECAQKCAETIDRMIVAKEVADKALAEENERKRKQKEAEAKAAAEEAERQRVLAEKVAAEKKARQKKTGIIVGLVAAVASAAFLIITKVIIPGNQYKAAEALFEAGQYEEATAAFEAMNGYKDSADRILQSKYAAAEAMLKAGQYEKAVALFESLNGYSDSNSRIDEINGAILDRKYDEAEEIQSSGDIPNAALAFGQLGDYQDAHMRSFSLWEQIADRKTIAVGSHHVVGIRTNGTVLATGRNDSGQCDVTGWSEIVAVAAGNDFTMGLRADGTVLIAGNDHYFSKSIADCTDIVAISAMGSNMACLHADGTVSGSNDYWGHLPNMTGIIAIAVGPDYIAGLTNGGTVKSLTSKTTGRPPELPNTNGIISIASGESFLLGLLSNGKVIMKQDSAVYHSKGLFFTEWTDIVAIAEGDYHSVGLKSDGTVIAYTYEPYSGGKHDMGQGDVSAWDDIVAIAAGGCSTVGLTSNGTVVIVGEISNGECDVSLWSDIKLPNT